MKYYGVTAMNGVTTLRLFLIYLVLTSMYALNAKTLQQMQELYRNIGNDLMSIRKEFTAAQPKVYSILDRVDKMYNLAKVTAEKKHNLSVQLKNQSSETKKLYDEINTLKSKIAVHEEDLANAHKKLELTKNALEKERVQAEQFSQEKANISKQQANLNKIKTDTETDKKRSESRDLMHEIRNLNGLSEEEQNLLKQAQSLSLSSTSAPSSPR